MSFYKRLIVCFFLSGATGLIYEVAWVRMLAQSYGNTVYAVGVVLTAFMTGLSLGSYILGKVMDKSQKPLVFYALIEGGIAFFSLLSIFFLRHGPTIYIETLSLSSPLWAQVAVKYTLSVLLLLPATFLMGGTLPVLSKILIRSDSELEAKLGSIYSINTLGGALGTFVAGFFLIHHIGISATILVGVGVNISIAIYVYILSLRPGGRFAREDWQLPEQGSDYTPKENYSPLILLGLMLSGCSVMLYEVAWNRLLVSIIGSTTYSLSLILFGVLLGIGLGSLAVSRISAIKKLGLEYFAAMQLFLGATCFVPVVLFRFLPDAMHMGIKAASGDFVLVTLFKFLIVLSLVLAPMLFFGSSFPIIGAIYRRGYLSRGRDIGSLYAVNTAGAIIGSVLASFWILPNFGSTITIKSAAMVNILAGILALWSLGKRRLAFAAISVIIVPLLPFDIPHRLMDTGVAVYGHLENYDPKAPSSRTMFMKEGLNSNISVMADSDGLLSLRTNGKADGSIFEDMRTQLALGYVPMLLHPKPKDTLVIGLGTGVTLRALSEFSDMERVDCVEIEPAVLEAMEYFTVAHHGVLTDPRVNLVIEDARKYMLMTRQEYDVIISEPSNPWISGIGNLFTREFYSTALSRLRDDGLFVQWMHMYNIEPYDLKMIMATMTDVFPELSVWQVNSGDLLITGGREPVDVLDMEAIQMRMDEYKGHRGGDLRAYLNITSPMDLSGLFLFGTDEVRLLSRGSMVITDDKPTIEFRAPLSLNSKERIWMNLQELFPSLRPPDINGYSSEPDTKAQYYYLKARSNLELNIGDISYLETALRHEPMNPDYLALQGRRLYLAGYMQRSAEVLKHALEADPDSAEANYQMGVLLSLYRDTLEQAIVHFEKAASADPDNFNYRVEAGFQSSYLGKYREAIYHYRKALALPHTIKKTMEVSGQIGLAYEKLGETELAEKSFREPLAINPYYIQSLMNLAMLYIRSEATNNACDMIELALEVAPDAEKDYMQRLMEQNCSGR